MTKKGDLETFPFTREVFLASRWPYQITKIAHIWLKDPVVVSNHGPKESLFQLKNVNLCKNGVSLNTCMLSKTSNGALPYPNRRTKYNNLILPLTKKNQKRFQCLTSTQIEHFTQRRTFTNLLQDTHRSYSHISLFIGTDNNLSSYWPLNWTCMPCMPAMLFIVRGSLFD